LKFAGKIGVVCPTCGIKLRVLDDRLLLYYLAQLVVFACAAATLRALGPTLNKDVSVVILLAFVMTGFVLFQKAIPRLLRLRPLEEGEKPGFPLETLKEDLAALREQREDNALDLEPVSDTGPSWICPKCQAENPGNFDECWKCQTWRTDEKESGSSPAPK
jgi:hypothetical protein